MQSKRNSPHCGEILVALSGNRQQFLDWCEEHSLAPDSFVLAEHPDDLYGIHPDDARIYLCGKFWTNPLYKAREWDFFFRHALEFPANEPARPFK